MSHRFYINCPLAPGPLRLEGDEAHHLAVVCRLRLGDSVCLFNGTGSEFPAMVMEVQRRSVVLDVQNPLQPGRELPFSLEVAAPLPKGDRGQFLVEKLTELGVSSYVPLRTERSVVHPGEGRVDKLERYVVEASKQCGRNRLMQIKPLQKWESYCQEPILPELRILAHPTQMASQPWNPAAIDQVVAVGPEGGFTEGEVSLAQANGWQLIDLGPRILRIETAALALVSRISAVV
jgi:16S rRNA (uracil1498-N3)-methyltransferase